MLATGNIVIQDDDADAPKAQKKLAQEPVGFEAELDGNLFI